MKRGKRPEPCWLSTQPMQEHIPAYLESLRQAGREVTTQRNYKCKLTQYLAWRLRTGQPDPPTAQELREFLRFLQVGDASGAEPHRPRTIRVSFTALYSFFEWLEDQGIAKDLPRRGSIKLPRLDQAQRETPTEGEMVQLLQAAERLPAHTPHRAFVRGRTRAVLALFANCGLRRSELLALNVGDLNLDLRRLHVRRGKGGEARWVPLNETAAVILGEWLAVREEWCRQHEAKLTALFPVDKKRRLSHRGLEALWAELLAAAGLSGRNLTPHGLRHWFATQAAAIVDITTASALLGHSRVETTIKYLHTSADNMSRAVEGLGMVLERREPGGSAPSSLSPPEPAKAPEATPYHRPADRSAKRRGSVYRRARYPEGRRE